MRDSNANPDYCTGQNCPSQMTEKEKHSTIRTNVSNPALQKALRKENSSLKRGLASAQKNLKLDTMLL